MQSDVIYMRKKVIYIITGCVMSALLILSLLVAYSRGLLQENGDYIKMLFAATGMIFATILFICCCFNIHDNMHQVDTLAAISVLLYLALLLSGMIDVFGGNGTAGRTIMALQTITAVCSTAVHFLFWRYQCASLPESRTQKYFTRWIYFLIVAYLAVLAVNPFTGVLFVVDASGNLISTGETLEIIFISLFYLTFLLYILPQHCSLRKKLSLASFALLPMLVIVMTAVWYAAGIKYTIQSITYIFLLMATYVVFFGDYIESKELLLKQETALAEMKSQLMLSQLNPHFVANTLNSIVALCRFDPPEAEKATRMFAGYLRENYVDMEGNQMVPFEKALKNMKNYIAIEQIRFPDLQVKYDISCSQFDIPTMTIQPLVENAITHGIHGKGQIIISTAETLSDYMVIVKDNGVGYCEAPEDERTHLGIANCRERLKTLCGGSVSIHTGDDGGTVCEITIPKGGKSNEHSMH